MNLLCRFFVAALLAHSVAAIARPDPVGVCPTACMAEKEHCVQKLGVDADENCKVGMRICIERCNPTGQNTASFDAADERARTAKIRGADTAEGRKVRGCEQRCEVSSTVCARSGPTATNECGLGRQSCLDRCYGK